MELTAFTLALALLLAAPGPTNTVMAMAGARAGMLQGLRLSFAVLLGYFTTVLPLVFYVSPYFQAHPRLAASITLLSAFWVLGLGARLWRGQSRSTEERAIGAWTVYTTTVLNPKGLIIGLTLMPDKGIDGSVPYLAILVAMVLVVNSLWLGLGATVIRKLSQRHPVAVSRGAASCLLFFAAGLAVKAAGVF